MVLREIKLSDYKDYFSYTKFPSKGYLGPALVCPGRGLIREGTRCVPSPAGTCNTIHGSQDFGFITWSDEDAGCDSLWCKLWKPKDRRKPLSKINIKKNRFFPLYYVCGDKVKRKELEGSWRLLCKMELLISLMSSFIRLCAGVAFEFTVLIDCVWLRNEPRVCELSDLSFL